MLRKNLTAIVIALSLVSMSASSGQAQQYTPAPPAYAAPSYAWNERSFMIALRARWFANSMERQGYIVQLHRVGLFNWSVRYRMA